MNVNEIENVNENVESNPILSSIPLRSDNYIIPGLDGSIGTPSETLGSYDKINQHFSDQDQQNRTITEAREILGESSKDLEDEQVYSLVSEIQFLVDSWLEEYERKVFDGKTLDELIKI